MSELSAASAARLLAAGTIAGAIKAMAGSVGLGVARAGVGNRRVG